MKKLLSVAICVVMLVVCISIVAPMFKDGSQVTAVAAQEVAPAEVAEEAAEPAAEPAEEAASTPAEETAE